MQNVISPTGNRTPVSRVTGGDTYHYTIEDDWYKRKVVSYRDIDLQKVAVK